MLRVNQLFFLSCSSCVQLLTDSIGQLLGPSSDFSGKQEVTDFHLTRRGTHLSFPHLVHAFCILVLEPKWWGFFNFILSYWLNNYQLCLKAFRLTGVKGAPSQA